MDQGTQKQQPTSDLIEEKLVAFAEQLGGVVGTVQAKAEGWLDRSALAKEIGRIRDNAADLLARWGKRTSRAAGAADEANRGSQRKP